MFRVLVVDDESRMRKLIKDFLAQKGYSRQPPCQKQFLPLKFAGYKCNLHSSADTPLHYYYKVFSKFRQPTNFTKL